MNEEELKARLRKALREGNAPKGLTAIYQGSKDDCLEFFAPPSGGTARSCGSLEFVLPASELEGEGKVYDPSKESKAHAEKRLTNMLKQIVAEKIPTPQISAMEGHGISVMLPRKNQKKSDKVRFLIDPQCLNLYLNVLEKDTVVKNAKSEDSLQAAIRTIHELGKPFQKALESKVCFFANLGGANNLDNDKHLKQWYAKVDHGVVEWGDNYPQKYSAGKRYKQPLHYPFMETFVALMKVADLLSIDGKSLDDVSPKDKGLLLDRNAISNLARDLRPFTDYAFNTRPAVHHILLQKALGVIQNNLRERGV